MTTSTPALPDQDEVTYCAVHTEVEASLRCIRCNRYMCIKCVVRSPVGYICRECARRHDDRFFNAANTDPMIIFAVCAALTGGGAYFLSTTAIPLLFLLFVGIPVGGVIGEASLRATGRRKGRNSAWISAAGCVIGGLIGVLLQMLIAYSGSPQFQQMFPSVMDYITTMLTSNWSALFFIGISAFVVYGRYRSRI